MQSVQPFTIAFLEETLTVVEGYFELVNSGRGNIESLRPGIEACERIYHELHRTHRSSSELYRLEQRINSLNQRMVEQAARIQKIKEDAFVNLFSFLTAVCGIFLGYYFNPHKE